MVGCLLATELSHWSPCSAVGAELRYRTPSLVGEILGRDDARILAIHDDATCLDFEIDEFALTVFESECRAIVHIKVDAMRLVGIAELHTACCELDRSRTEQSKHLGYWALTYIGVFTRGEGEELARHAHL